MWMERKELLSPASVLSLQTQLTEHQFLQALHNDDMWEAADGGVTEAIKDGSDFLALLRGQSCAHVVLLQEG